MIRYFVYGYKMIMRFGEYDKKWVFVVILGFCERFFICSIVCLFYVFYLKYWVLLMVFLVFYVDFGVS